MPNKKEKMGAIPTPLKVLIVIAVIILTFLIGAMIGFGLLGDGNPFAVFSQNTWEHIFSFFTKGPKN
ncbi:DNA-directed RNA polymerase subunit beta [Carnobacterium maltaromaticum]|uniref:DNA-directed RNA polymerase subunit beta n=1 Tax=Carnobacterium maltaromaticum TaxID=2751 RepID=UPI0039B04D39